MRRRTFLGQALGGLTLSVAPEWLGPASAWAQSGTTPSQAVPGASVCRPNVAATLTDVSGDELSKLGRVNFVGLYARNRDDGAGHLITESALLHLLALSLKKSERDYESDTLIPAFGRWIAAVAEAARAQSEPAGLATNFVTLVAALATGDALIGDIVQREAALINSATAPARSPLLGVELDYSAFRPRGRYADDPELRRYFVASRYASAAPFFLQPSSATQVSEAGARRLFASAKQISDWMNAGAVAGLTSGFFAALERAFGAAEDFSALDFAGDTRDLEIIRADWITNAATRGRRPSVIDVILDADALAKNEKAADSALSWRFLPGRRLADVAALQALTYPNTGAAQDPKARAFGLGDIRGQKVKAYVGLDDYLALLSLNAAAKTAETGFSEWDQAFEQAKAQLFGKDGTDVAPFTRFARNVLRSDRPDRAIAIAGHYVHYRHSRLLYAKQSTSSDPKGLTLRVDQSAPFLATDTGFIAAFSELVLAYKAQHPASHWDLWTKFCADLPAFEAAQMKGCLSTAVAARFNRFDQELAPAFDAADDHPIVADIHTAPSEKRAVEIGLGFARVLRNGGARGAAFNIYQFKQPVSKRLSDSEFAAMLQSGDCAALAWPKQT